MSAKPKYSLSDDVEERALDASRKGCNTGQRAMIAARLLDGVKLKQHGISYEQVALTFGVAVTTLRAAGRILRGGTPQEVANAEAGRVAINVLAREIGQGLPPEERSSVAPGRYVPHRTGRLAGVVYARIAEEKGKRLPVPSFRKRRPALVEVLPVPEGGPVPEPAPLTFQDAVDRLIQASNELSVHEAACELGLASDPKAAARVFSDVMMWLIEVSDQLDILVDVRSC